MRLPRLLCPAPLSRTPAGRPPSAVAQRRAEPGSPAGRRRRTPSPRSGPARAAQRAEPPLARSPRAGLPATPTRARSRLRRLGRPDEYASPRARPRLLLSVSFPPPGGSEEPRFPRAGPVGAGRGRTGGGPEKEKAGEAAAPAAEHGRGAERVRGWPRSGIAPPPARPIPGRGRGERATPRPRRLRLPSPPGARTRAGRQPPAPEQPC